MRVTRNGPRRAFTLVELLVVIGIIAALIGILLPVLSGVQARGRDIKCQSNIRQILQAIHGYAAENKGSLPYGFYFAKSHPVTWDDDGSNGYFVSWASQVGKYMVRKASGDNENENFPPVLQCPEAATVYTHIVGYVANFVPFASPYYEYVAAPAFKPLWDKPAKTTQLFGHNILIFDTSVSPGLENSVGYLTGADVDNQRFWEPQNPQWRFYDPADPYGRIPPGIMGNNKPVQIDAQWKNVDPTDPEGDGPGYPYQGNIRFRHGKNTTMNAGFADGHVEGIAGKFSPDRKMIKHDVQRKFFMMKWPSGIPRNQGIP
jgi:prepilin-type N-terminal cleavage/methylation domain-containing protein/prepilin-type processing-associated H-X9-DG protein